MHKVFRDAEIFHGLSSHALQRLEQMGRSRALATGDYLFLLGDSADCLYLVQSGTIDLCLPITVDGAVNDVTVETATQGKALGWSALVKPYRFTLSARAAEPGTVIGFPRSELQDLFDSSPDAGKRFHANLSELVGERLLTFQTLWVRELQHAVLAQAGEPV